MTDKNKLTATSRMDSMESTLSEMKGILTQLTEVVTAKAQTPTGETAKPSKVTGIDTLIESVEIPDKFTTVKNPSGSQHPSVKRVRKLARGKNPVASLQEYIDATGPFAVNAAGEARSPLSPKGWAFKFASQMQATLSKGG